MFEVLLSIIAVYYITLLLTEFDLPYNVGLQLRHKFKALSCFVCTSIWVSIPFAVFLASNPLEAILYAFALAGGATIVYEFLDR